MAQLSGIKFEKDSKGNNRYVRIDLRKYGNEIEPSSIKHSSDFDEQFEKDWENSLTPNQFKDQMHKRIKNWFA